MLIAAKKKTLLSSAQGAKEQPTATVEDHPWRQKSILSACPRDFHRGIALAPLQYDVCTNLHLSQARNPLPLSRSSFGFFSVMTVMQCILQSATSF
jgi:hypothetical protein